MPETIPELFTLYWRTITWWNKAVFIGYALTITIGIVVLMLNPSWGLFWSGMTLTVMVASFIGLDYLLGLIKHGVLEENHAVARAIIEQDMNP